VKFSVRQILASAAGAVLAAVIASVFGVKGTIIGVALGSAAATFGTALVAESLDRGHRAVQQVVIRAPETATLLRRLGGTSASSAAMSAGERAPFAEEVTTSAVQPTEPVEAPVPEPGLPSESATASETPERRPRSVRWPVIAGTAAVVFLLSLMFVTAIELIAGRPLADLFGGHSKGGGTTVQQIIAPPPTTVPMPTTTTSTSSTTTSSSPVTSTTAATTTTSGTGTTSSTTAGGTAVPPSSTTSVALG